MASTHVETVSTGADKAKLAAALALVMVGLTAYYFLAPQGQLAQWGALLVLLALAAAAFLSSETGRQLIAFGRESEREVRKVVWPTRKEATQMTAYVFGFVVIMALFLWVTDKTIDWVFFDLILGWRK
jgi:preprotein translocase subunit SecE